MSRDAFELRGPIVVLGVGAIGGTTGGRLLRAGRELFLVDGWFENVEAIRREGLSITFDGQRETVAGTALYLDELDRLPAPAQVVLLACKSYDTDLLVRQVLPCLADDGVIVSLQNSINEDRIAALAGPERTLGCVVHYNGGMMEPAHATRYSPSHWHSYSVGELDGTVTRRAEAIAELLGDAGETDATDDIWGVLWAKLSINCMTNGLTALTDLATPLLWSSPVAQPVLLKIVAEAAMVARAQDREMAPIHLIASDSELPSQLVVAAGAGDAGAYEQALARLSAEAGKRKEAWLAAGGAQARQMASSMLQDIRKGRRPEIDYMNGYVAREGRHFGIPTPACDAVTAYVRDLAAGKIAQDTAHLDAIAAELGLQAGS